MQNHQKFYINGQWVDPLTDERIDVINPATEKAFSQIGSAGAEDVDRAVNAARDAFNTYSTWDVEQRLTLLEAILESYKERYDDIAGAISMEMGAPLDLARGYQTQLGQSHIVAAMQSLRRFRFESEEDGMVLRHEPIGVCGLITPWNWPLSQVAVKVFPALAAGCTVVLKPSEESPLGAMVFAEVMDQAGVPPGVFNLINGYGPVAGNAISSHPNIDMISFTGSTRGGIAVAKSAANSVKRVGQELGGKSANIILEDANLSEAVIKGIHYGMGNSGQSCNAPTRMLVPEAKMDEAIEAAQIAVGQITVDDPALAGDHLGPVINLSQFEKIQELIHRGINEGATLIAGGPGRPSNFETGYYVKPTVFANVDNNMVIAREEIFGPVICIIGYQNEEEAIRIANDSDYGLAGYVCSENMEHAKAIASRLRAGQIAINYKGGNAETPFGGYKQSGNGRDRGKWGLLEFLEVKAITGL